MWYLLDEMLRVYREARAHVPGLRFLILNRDEHELIRSAVGADDDGIVIRAAQHEEMPTLLAGCHVGISLIRPGPSKRGSSPIKVAEYLACGLPVIVNAGVGDTDRLIARYRAGHVMQSLDDVDTRAAGLALAALLGDNEARSCARRLAEAEYDVRTGIARYAEVYERALS
jgi:glycosyltransferase involved in cell wall biosynthesis